MFRLASAHMFKMIGMPRSDGHAKHFPAHQCALVSFRLSSPLIPARKYQHGAFAANANLFVLLVSVEGVLVMRMVTPRNPATMTMVALCRAFAVAKLTTGGFYLWLEQKWKDLASSGT